MVWTKHRNERSFRILTGYLFPLLGKCLSNRIVNLICDLLWRFPFFLHKKTQHPIRMLRPFSHNKKTPKIRTCRLFGIKIWAVLLTRASAVLHSLLRFLQWPAFATCRTSTHTVAVPSGIFTRFSILLWGCYRFHRHSNHNITAIIIPQFSFLSRLHTSTIRLPFTNNCN